MRRIVLCTSSSGLDNLNIKTTIRQIRLRIYVNNVEFIDGKNINVDALIEMMRNPSHSPVYTRPAPASEVLKMLTELEVEGYKEVFIVSTSAKTSDSYDTIKTVADMFEDRMNILVYDCKEFSVCESMLALEAEYMMSQGHSMTDIVTSLNDLRARHKMLFPIESLKYLIKNKKLSQTSGFFANLLNIKPVLHVTNEGYIEPISKVRKFEKALDLVVKDFAVNMQHNDSQEVFAYVLSAGRPDIDEKMVAKVKQETKIKHLPILPASAVAVANHGPTGVGLCAFFGITPNVTSHFIA